MSIDWIWQILPCLRRNTLMADGRLGRASVLAQQRSVNELLVYEKGCWQDLDKGAFYNRLVWRREGEELRLFHARRCLDTPVLLARFVDDGFVTKAPHQCGLDTYSASLQKRGGGFCLSWEVKGPSKKMQIKNLYEN